MESVKVISFPDGMTLMEIKDIILKLQIVLKEFRKTLIALEFINRAELSYDPELVAIALRKKSELFSTLVKSVNTT